MLGPEVVAQTYPVRLRSRGQITIPQIVRDDLDVGEGDFLTLVKVGDILLLLPKQPEAIELTRKFTQLMNEAGVTLADLLQGLEEERAAIWEERYGQCAASSPIAAS